MTERNDQAPRVVHMDVANADAASRGAFVFERQDPSLEQAVEAIREYTTTYIGYGPTTLQMSGASPVTETARAWAVQLLADYIEYRIDEHIERAVALALYEHEQDHHKGRRR